MKKILSWTLVLSLFLFSLINCSLMSSSSNSDAYKVIYNDNGSTGGTVPKDNNEYETGTVVTVLGNGSLVKAECTFAGWTLTADGSGTAYYASSKLPMGNSTINLYARWSTPASDFTYTDAVSGEVGITGFAKDTDTTEVTRVIFPEKDQSGDTVTSIESEAFLQDESLASVTIPDSVTSIESYAFENCTSLASITIPDSVTSIESGAFYNCTSLASVTIPDSVTSIESWAFAVCTSLASVTIPDSVTSIGPGAFAACTSLASVTIPDSITSIEFEAFANCQKLTSVTVLATTPPTLGNDAFTSLATTYIIYVPSGSVTAYKNATCDWKDLNIQAIE